MGLTVEPEPLVVRAARGFRADLLARDATQMRQMAQRWLQVETSLRGQIEALVEEMNRLKAQGKTPSRSQVFRLRRARSLLLQASEQFEDYAVAAAGMIEREQRVLGELGLDHATQMTQLTLLDAGIRTAFDRLPVGAVERMVGIAGNGSPLGELLKLRIVRDANGAPLPGVWDRLVETLVQGTAQGWNPRRTARAMRDDLAGGLNKALQIARTEQLRVYRMLSADQYAASGVVSGHKRVSAHDGRVCAACIADEGTVYNVRQPITDHPQGRCTSVPVVSGMPQLNWLAGEAWFRQQGRDVQESILGVGRLQAWEEGGFAFRDLVTHTHSEVWGDGLVPTPLSELVNDSV